MNRKTNRINVFNQKRRKILCIANEYDYFGDGSMIHEKKLLIGEQYTFVRGEAKSYGLMVYLEELPNRYGYQSYLFEELHPYDVKILERDYNYCMGKKLDECETTSKGRHCDFSEKLQNLNDRGCVSERITERNSTIYNQTEEYKKIESNSQKSVRAKLERMKELCKERDNLYEKQKDLTGQKQRIKESLER